MHRGPPNYLIELPDAHLCARVKIINLPHRPGIDILWKRSGNHRKTLPLIMNVLKGAAKVVSIRTIAQAIPPLVAPYHFYIHRWLGGSCVVLF